MTLNAKTDTTRLFFRRLRVQASVGVLPEEKTGLQPLLLDIDVEVPRSAACSETDSIHDVFDYRVIHQHVLDIVNSQHFHLLETLAHEILHKLAQDLRVLAVRVEIHKTQPYPDAESVGVEVLYRLS
jgi:dihydroneopterin aldolase